jgi:hypothetical protein
LLLNSEISEEKIAAYQATHYRVGSGPDGFVLCIGRHSLDLQRLYLSSGQSCGVFITAFNPFGQVQGDEANEAAHALLGEHLREKAPLAVEGSGADPTGPWPAEKSYFALGMNEDAARILGKLWDQDAVVWVGEDAVPKLILLR